MLLFLLSRPYGAFALTYSWYRLKLKMNGWSRKLPTSGMCNSKWGLKTSLYRVCLNAAKAICTIRGLSLLLKASDDSIHQPPCLSPKCTYTISIQVLKRERLKREISWSVIIRGLYKYSASSTMVSCPSISDLTTPRCTYSKLWMQRRSSTWTSTLTQPSTDFEQFRLTSAPIGLVGGVRIDKLHSDSTMTLCHDTVTPWLPVSLTPLQSCKKDLRRLMCPFVEVPALASRSPQHSPTGKRRRHADEMRE